MYPKYISYSKEPLNEMKQILKVLEKYNHSKEQIVNIFNGDGSNKSFNTLALILYFLNDYYEYGIYDNNEDIIEINGEGEVLWGKSIDEAFPFIKDNMPYYMELYTRKTINDEDDYIKKLHEFVITECSRQLCESELDKLFELEPIELSEDTIDSFGEKEYILDRIYAELNLQYNSRKQILLKTLYAYISQDKKLNEYNQGISMFGTNSFNMVWEDACSEVFDNKLYKPIKDLPISTKNKYKPNDKLIDIIKPPLWTKGELSINAKKTLIPDLVSISKIDNINYFIIFDAKYYNLTFEKNILKGNPGVSDITKQYLYQLAFMNFIKDNNFEKVINCFLMPTEQNEIIDVGKVSMDILSNLGLNDIEVRKIPATTLYRYYLSNKKIDFSKLKL